ncbi:MAG: M23 family metallopeptidase [Lysobacteraceae bacterium]|nr:MAG: M23 family metallopeptidase [Xanthomonadaceae bacterium]
MKWLMTFLLGVLVGAGGLFVVLRAVPDEPAPVVAAAPPAAGVPAAQIDPQLPGPPSIQPDLSEFDLPLRPPSAAVAGTGAASSAQAPADAVAAAVHGKLLVPVQGLKKTNLSDTYDQPRGNQRHHEALDIMAPKGTPVLAAADGKVAKLFTSKPGGTTLYQFDRSEKYAYYYAHLDRYADGIKEGMEVKRGDVIGHVGVTGNSDPNAPHLHFAVFELTPEKQWWKGTPLNPFPLMTDQESVGGAQ